MIAPKPYPTPRHIHVSTSCKYGQAGSYCVSKSPRTHLSPRGRRPLSLPREDSQISFKRVVTQGDLLYRQYCLLPAPKHLF